MEDILQRLNEAANTAWPFVEDSPFTASYGVGGTRLLQKDAVLDCHAVVYGYIRGTLKLAAIRVSGDGATATFAFIFEPQSGTDITFTLGGVPASSAWDSMELYRGSVQYATPDTTISLYVVFGRGVRTFCTGEAGNTFTFDGLAVEPACIRPANRHFVRSCSASSGATLTGNVKLMSGYNMDVMTIAASNSVRLSADIGLGEGTPCGQLFPPSTADCADLVYFINGIGPDWRGAFKFMPGNGIEIESHPATYTVTLRTPYLACNPGCMDESSYVPPTPLGQEGCVSCYVPVSYRGGTISIDGGEGEIGAYSCKELGQTVSMVFQALSGFVLSDVLVDNVSMGAIGTYDLDLFLPRHYVEARFEVG